MPRFVVLKHVLPEGASRATHWDLMIEQEAGLVTWALSRAPEQGVEIPAEALAEHRKKYLDYEGPVSGNRGEVSQWDAGDCDVLTGAADRWVIALRGRRLQGEATLERNETDQNWRFFFSARSARS